LNFTTHRLSLRTITIEDAPYVLAQLNDAGWIKNIGDRNVHSLEEAKDYIADKILPSLEKPECAFFVVSKKSDPDTIIGQCGIFKRAGLNNPDLGFAFLEAYCGQGYGYEAAAAVMSYASKTMQLSKLVAITSDDNIASQALLRKLGMKHTKNLHLPNITGNNRYYE